MKHPLSYHDEKNLRRRMKILSPLGTEFHFYIKDRRLFHNDGIELTDDEAKLVLRGAKREMRDARRPDRSPCMVGSRHGRAFAIHQEAATDAAGRLLGFGPGLSELADVCGRQESRRWRLGVDH